MRIRKRILKASVPTIVADVIGATRQFRASHGRFPNLVFPKTFNEKVLRRSLFDSRPILRKFTDKYEVRAYVQAVAGAELLPQIYCLAEHPRQIDFRNLPDRFVVKPTHGSGWVSIIRDKAALDIPSLISRCNCWLSQNYANKHHERIYRSIPPRIMVEELIDDGTDGGPIDYKFFVFHGRVEMIGAIFGRFAQTYAYHCDRDWNQIHVGLGYPALERRAAAPKQLHELVRIAELLGKDLEFVRVDLYAPGSRIIFGEMTTTPGAGLDIFHPASFDEYLGSLW